jgi:saccharopine dehydrogenase-like NADP-dependent oxidoreductase
MLKIKQNKITKIKTLKEDTMKIVVLGGAGDMGSRVVEDLAQAEGIEQVTIADRNLEAARQIASRLQKAKAKVDIKSVDANDHYGLMEVMRGYDVAASALGPFYLFEAKLVRAAIDAGVNYTSICDDWLAADEVINQFSEKAREKGITVISGLGASPGLSNVGVHYLAQRMDKVHRADIYVYMPLNSGGGEAVLGHTLFIMGGKIPVWRGGKRMMVPACSEERMIEFPKFGAIKVWNMGHGEPVTVPLFIPGIEEVNLFMGFGRGSNWLVLPAKLGFFGGKRRRQMALRLLNSLKHLGKPQEPEWGAIRIDVWGEQGGKEAHGIGCGIGQMRESTGISLAVGTLMLARKEILTTEGGVYGPEACLEPIKFFTYMKERGITSYSDLEMTKPII